MTPREALDRVNGAPPISDILSQLFDSGPIRIALTAFFIGMAWSDLHSEIRENKMESDTRFAVMASDLHALKVLACRAYPNDSVCAVAP